MPIATLSSKGQLTVPKEIRDELGMRTGDRVLFWRDPEGRIIVQLVNRDIRTLRGMLKGSGPHLTVEEMEAHAVQAAAEANR